MNSKQFSVIGGQWVVLWLLLLAMIGCGSEVGEGAMAVPQPTSISLTEEIVATDTAVPQATPVAEEVMTIDTAVPQPTNTTEPVSETAADADVLNVQATQTGDETWSFSVTVAHPDNGWEDYADGWDVVLPDGTVIKPDPDSPFTRLLLHPHDTEQPFTRSQSGIIIPADVTQVTVRAHDLVDGFGGQEVVVDLTAVSGEGFTVQR